METTFDKIYRIADESGSESAFNKQELEKLYDLCWAVPSDGFIVEIGVQFGRSTSLIAEVCKRRSFKKEQFTAIDNYLEDVSTEARRHVHSQTSKYGWNFVLEVAESSDAAFSYSNPISLIHIDGDHEYEAVLQDCELWLPKLVVGGYVCFDDYGHDSLPGVYKAVSEYMEDHPEFEFIGRYGEKLGVFRRTSI